MTHDIFTLHKDDLLIYASKMLDWSDYPSLCVEDKNGNLVGVIRSKQILNYYARAIKNKSKGTVKDVMDDQPITVTQQMKIIDVIDIMKRNHLKMIPVVKGKELIGIISERDFMAMSKRLIERTK